MEAAPTYESRYDDTIQDLIAGLLDRPDFSYDPATDPSTRTTASSIPGRASGPRRIPWRGGRRLRRNPLLLCQRRRQPGVQLLLGPANRQDSRPLPTGLQPVSERLQHGFEQPWGCPGAEQSDYDKYLNQLNQYNTDRNFSYGQFLDELSSQNQRRTDALNEAVLAGGNGRLRWI